MFHRQLNWLYVGTILFHQLGQKCITGLEAIKNEKSHAQAPKLGISSFTARADFRSLPLSCISKITNLNKAHKTCHSLKASVCISLFHEQCVVRDKYVLPILLMINIGLAR